MSMNRPPTCPRVRNALLSASAAFLCTLNLGCAGKDGYVTPESALWSGFMLHSAANEPHAIPHTRSTTYKGGTQRRKHFSRESFITNADSFR